MRQLKPRQKAEVKRVREMKGIETAVKRARRLAHLHESCLMLWLIFSMNDLEALPGPLTSRIPRWFSVPFPPSPSRAE
jgi:hypothetical protein